MRELGSFSWELSVAVQAEKRGKKRNLEEKPPAIFQFKVTRLSTRHTISTVRRRSGRPSHRLLWRSTSKRLVGAATAGMSPIELMLRNNCQTAACSTVPMQHLALLLCGKTDGDVEPDAAEAQDDASFCILIRKQTVKI